MPRSLFVCSRCGNRLRELEELVAKLVKGVRLSGEPTESQGYLASDQRSTFHRPGCVWADAIAPSNLIVFGSHDAAVEAGYRPCKTCRA